MISDADVAAAGDQRSGAEAQSDAAFQAEPKLGDGQGQPADRAINLSEIEFSESWLLFGIEITTLLLWSVFTGLAYHTVALDITGHINRYAATGLLVGLIFCGAKKLSSPPQNAAGQRRLEKLLQTLTFWCGSFLFLSFIAFSLQAGKQFSRGAVLSFFFTGLPVLFFVRQISTKIFAKKLYQNSLRSTNAVIVGGVHQAIADAIQTFRARGCTISSVVEVNTNCSNRDWHLELESVGKRITSLANKAGRGAIYVCAQDFPRDRLRMLLRVLRVLPRAIRIIPDAETAQLLTFPLFHDIDGVSVEVQNAPLTNSERLLKRGFDIIVASILILFLLPLFFVVALIIKQDSKGPVFFRQTRLGHHGRPFKIWKLRTMHVLDDGPHIEQAKEHDPRITRVGRFLRSSSLDELPQLINVILGDMSLVGPRPHAAAHDKFYNGIIQNYEVRQHVMPGITGWAQVHGLRGETANANLMWKRVEFDLWYAKNASLALDAEIILRTVGVIFGKSSPDPDIGGSPGKVMIYAMNYAPEPIGVGRYTADIGTFLSKQGIQVDVVTAAPHYPGWTVPEHYRNAYSSEKIGNLHITRCPLFLKKQMRGIWRLVAPMTFAITSAPIAFWRIICNRPGTIFCIEPTLLCAPAALVAAKITRSKIVLHVQDLEIDAAFAVGHLRGKYLQGIANAVERSMLRSFDGLVTISHNMMQKLTEKGIPKERITVVRNWVDLDQIKPLKRHSSYRADLKLSDSCFVALYAGNIGEKQGLSIVLSAAELLTEHADLIFVIAGQGPSKAQLVEQYGHLPNVRFLPVQPENRLNELLNLADVHLLPQRRDTADLVLPSKLGGMLASGKQCIVMADPGTELYEFLGNGATILPPGDHLALAQAIRSSYMGGSSVPGEANSVRIAELDSRNNLPAVGLALKPVSRTLRRSSQQREI
jgi:colanic acid biosynthesis glycosyl transferase WcaI